MLQANPNVQVRVIQRPPPPPGPPGSEHELHALAAKRSELAQQLEALTDRREEVADQLHGAESAARPGIVARLGILDERIARLEQEVLQADDAIASGVASGIIVAPMVQTETIEPPEMRGFSDPAITVIVGEALAFLLLGIFLYRLGWRRAKASFAHGATPESGRIDQLQNSVDAIAVEIERISEGQRYVSKKLSEGSAQPIDVEAGEESLVRRKAT